MIVEADACGFNSPLVVSMAFSITRFLEISQPIGEFYLKKKTEVNWEVDSRAGSRTVTSVAMNDVSRQFASMTCALGGPPMTVVLGLSCGALGKPVDNRHLLYAGRENVPLPGAQPSAMRVRPLRIAVRTRIGQEPRKAAPVQRQRSVGGP